MNVRPRIRRKLLQDIDWQKIQFAVPYPARSNDQIGKILYAFNGAPQDDYFKAIIMIHMHMHSG